MSYEKIDSNKHVKLIQYLVDQEVEKQIFRWKLSELLGDKHSPLRELQHVHLTFIRYWN